MNHNDTYGYMLEFKQPHDLVAASRELVANGYREIEAFTPFPVAELEQSLPGRGNSIAAWIFGGGVVGALCGYALQYFTAVVDYPILVGGKPMNSWPAFIPVTFELTVLFAAVTGFLAVLFSNGLPQLHHPIFEAKHFDLTSRDRFFLLVEASDPNFDRERTRAELERIPHAAFHWVPAQ